MKTLLFMWAAWRAYRQAGPNGSGYAGVFGVGGVCKVGVFVATGREAWRTSVRAIEDFQLE